MKGQTNLFAVIFFTIVLAVVSIVVILNYNGLVKADKAVDEARAQIETVLQRRLDLLPNLIETVKAYAKHERETLLAVTAARTKALGVMDEVRQKEALTKEQMIQLDAAQSQISKALKSIFALAENYPDLKSSSNFLALQDQFEGTENRIAVNRQRYNFAVRKFNSKIETFPGIFLAPMFGYEEKVFFEAEEEAYEPIKAQF